MSRPEGPADFAGRWRLARRIEDRLGGNATFEGQAEVRAEGCGFLYEERGEMVLADGQRLAAERRYLWRAGPGGIEVSFQDGRPFHFMPLSGGGDRHWCDPDDYRVAYDFARWPDWSAIWEVRGPRKNYRMTSLYAPWPAAGTGLHEARGPR